MCLDVSDNAHTGHNPNDQGKDDPFHLTVDDYDEKETRKVSSSETLETLKGLENIGKRAKDDMFELIAHMRTRSLSEAVCPSVWK